MSVTDLAGLDKKNASLKMKLKAASGYRCETDVPAISAVQWGAINAICEEASSAIGRQMLELFRNHTLAARQQEAQS